jgi:hypothetical protein
MKLNGFDSSAKNFSPIGHKRWVISEGYISETSDETIHVLNVSHEDARLEITLFYADREPVGPYLVSVPARRTRQIHLYQLNDPAPIPPDTNFASVVESNVLVVLQPSRINSRNEASPAMTTTAFADSDSIM